VTSQKPYLIRAIYDWLLDNECTPYLLVQTQFEGVQVPLDYVKDNRIVLNIAPDAIRELAMENDWITFSARFAGNPMEVFIPIVAVQAIYGKENNEGMYFPDEEAPAPEPPPSDGQPKEESKTKGRPSLKVVK
jgi:stringent starvation protein B